MVEPQKPIPILERQVDEPHKYRRSLHRFSRQFNFKPLSSSGHASVYSKKTGIVTIDCTFRCNESKWGVLREEKHPAGIIYIDLNLGPPKDHRILTARVTITLDQNHSYLAQLPTPKLHKQNLPVQITEYFGPKRLQGPERITDTATNLHLQAEVSAAGTSAKLPEYGTSKAFKQYETWTFVGQRETQENETWYNSLVWYLHENNQDVQTFHSNEIRTAFTFEHAGQPFIMTVHVEGKLKSVMDRVRNAMSFGGIEKKISTLVNFADYELFQEKLDDAAANLNQAMTAVNPEDTSGSSGSNGESVTQDAALRPAAQSQDADFLYGQENLENGVQDSGARGGARVRSQRQSPTEEVQSARAAELMQVVGEIRRIGPPAIPGHGNPARCRSKVDSTLLEKMVLHMLQTVACLALVLVVQHFSGAIAGNQIGSGKQTSTDGPHVCRAIGGLSNVRVPHSNGEQSVGDIA